MVYHSDLSINIVKILVTGLVRLALRYQKILHTLNFGVSEITHKAKVSSCPNLFFNIKNFVKIKLFRADH